METEEKLGGKWEEIAIIVREESGTPITNWIFVVAFINIVVKLLQVSFCYPERTVIDMVFITALSKQLKIF